MYNGMVVEIPLGQEGFTGSTSFSSMSPGQLTRANNISFQDGAISKEGGASQYTVAGHSLSTNTVTAGVSWNDGVTGYREVVYLSNGNLRKDTGDGKFSTSLKSGLTTGNLGTFCEGGAENAGNARKLFFCNGSNAVQVLSGSGATTADLATPAADWATTPVWSLCIHEGKLWAAAGHNVYFSAGTNHEDFTAVGAGFRRVFPGRGQRIYQILSYKNLVIIFKQPYGIYAVDTSNPDNTQWSTAEISGSIGLCSPRAAVAIENDIIFMDYNLNVQMLSGIQEFGDVGTKNLSHLHRLDQWVRTNIDATTKSKVQCIYHATKREVHFSMSAIGSGGVMNRRLVVDFNRRDLPRLRISARDICEALWMRRAADQTLVPMVGDVGKVYTIDTNIYTKDGVAYNSRFATPPLDFSFANPIFAGQKKLGQALQLTVSSSGQWRLSVDVYWDNKKYQTIHYDIRTTGLCILGSWVLGRDRLGGEIIQTVTKRLAGFGYRLQLDFLNSGSADNFSLSGAYLHFKPGSA